MPCRQRPMVCSLTLVCEKITQFRAERGCRGPPVPLPATVMPLRSRSRRGGGHAPRRARPAARTPSAYPPHGSPATARGGSIGLTGPRAATTTRVPTRGALSPWTRASTVSPPSGPSSRISTIASWP
jgi:hypothetical protein